MLMRVQKYQIILLLSDIFSCSLTNRTKQYPPAYSFIINKIHPDKQKYSSPLRVGVLHDNSYILIMYLFRSHAEQPSHPLRLKQSDFHPW